MNNRFRSLLAVGVLAAGGVVAAVAGTTMASADTTICQQYGTTTIQGKYVVMNNRWGTTAEQCISVTNTGFKITSQQGRGNTSGAPVSYPAAYVGCHYKNCSPGTNLPMQLSQLRSVNSSVDYTFVSGATYDAAFDIWLDPTAKKDGVNQTEIMIWFNRQGSIQPIGSSVGNATIGGKTWDVWRGSNGSNNVISFLAPSPINSWNFSVLDFINETVTRGLATKSWYLTSIQAGFEPWIGGAGLALNSFTADINSAGNNATPSEPPATSPSDPGSDPGPGTPDSACAVSYKANNWGSGYTADVTVKNTSTTPVNGWKLAFALGGGQQITSSWNATVTQSGTAVTAENISWNGNLAPSGTASFGFQASSNGDSAAPSGFSLNGTACTVG
jgi:hypothetical protein